MAGTDPAARLPRLEATLPDSWASPRRLEPVQRMESGESVVPGAAEIQLPQPLLVGAVGVWCFPLHGSEETCLFVDLRSMYGGQQTFLSPVYHRLKLYRPVRPGPQRMAGQSPAPGGRHEIHGEKRTRAGLLLFLIIPRYLGHTFCGLISIQPGLHLWFIENLHLGWTVSSRDVMERMRRELFFLCFA